MKKLITLFLILTSAYGRKVENPYKYVWNNKEGKIAGMKRFFLDVDKDGVSELFIGANSLYGNGGGVFHVFNKKDRFYSYLGEITINPNAIELYKKNGSDGIKSLWKLGLEKGILYTYQYSKNKFKISRSQEGKLDELKKSLSSVSVKLEESGKILMWLP